MKLFVKSESVCDHQASSDKEYDWWERRCHPEIHGVYLEGSGYDYEAFAVDYDVEAGDTVYVLVMVYSAGDSFGTGTGNHEVLWVFKDKEVALKVVEYINTSEREGDDRYLLLITTDTGQTITLSDPSGGYFNSMENLSIESFVVV